jgi:hypothetical protein
MAGLSEADQKKVREARDKALNGRNMRDLSPEERAKVMEQVRKAVPALAAAPQGGPNMQGSNAAAPAMFSMVGRQYSEKEIQNAKLPEPVSSSGNQLDVLLRPGLLADVEIILEKIPDALNLPNQAVFEKDGKQIVYIKDGSRWEEREIKPLKRSETVMVIQSGVKPGEVVAMSDPYAKPGDKKEKSGSAGPMGGMPAGGRS